MTNRKIKSIIALMVLLGFSLTALAKRAFIENIGQITDQYQNKRPDIIAKYQADNGLNIFLSNSGIHYQWAKENEMYRMDVKLVGANPNPRISREAPTGLREQYQLAELKGTANGFGKIVYHDIYPDIDWVFYFNPNGKLEHDFIVRPGAQVSDIKLQYLGAENLQIDRFDNLVATTKYGSIKEPKPYSYEQSSRKKISSAYVLNNDILTFKTGKYQGTLIIDPVIEWATYIGGAEYDEIKDLKIGKDSFVYVVGSTNSSSNIATVGANLTTFQGGSNSTGSDAFIAKFSPDGTCKWATYYGGSNVDLGLSLAVDTSGYLYMAGRTNSQTGISTVGSNQPVKAGNASGYDAFLIKFDTSGIPLWGTYRGGNFNEGTTALSITADRYDNIYMAGNTNSSTGMATIGAFQQTRPGGEEGFISKFNTTGNLSWSTYYGSTMNDYINAVTTDTSGNIIIAGHTQGTTGLSTPGSYVEIGNGGTDGFVAKFDSNGQRIWGTYFGGTDYDKLHSIVTDSSSNIYFGGVTSSITDIATSSAHQPLMGGSSTDGVIGKLSEDGLLQWSSYYGGSGSDAVTSLYVSYEKLLVSGWTTSSNNIATTDGMVPVFNGSVSEGLLATFTPNGQRLWATYFGGDNADEISALTVSESEQVYLVGKTASVNGFASVGSHQTTFGGNQDGMLLKINMCQLPETPVAILGQTVACENSNQQYTLPPLTGADAFTWILPGGWTGTSTADTIDVTIGANGGEIKAVAINSCGSGDTISLEVTVNPSPAPTINRNGSILSVTQTFSSYQWLLNNNPLPGATGPTHIATNNGDYTAQVSGPNGCTGTSNAVTVDNSSGINDLSELGVKLYPNPCNDIFTIEVPVELHIFLTDITGKVIMNFSLAKGIREVDLTGIRAGNYMLNAYHPKNKQLLGAATLVKLSK